MPLKKATKCDKIIKKCAKRARKIKNENIG